MWLTCTSGMSSARYVPGKGPKGKAFGSSVLGAHHRLVGKWAGWWPLPPEIQFSEQNRTYRTISNQADVYKNLLWTLAKCRAMPSLKFVCRIVVCSVCSGVVSALPVRAFSVRTTRPTSIVPWAHLDPVKGNIQPLSFPSSHGYHMLSPKPPPKPRRSMECWRMVHPGRAARALQKDPLQLQRRSRELILFDSLLSRDSPHGNCSQGIDFQIMPDISKPLDDQFFIIFWQTQIQFFVWVETGWNRSKWLEHVETAQKHVALDSI